MASSLPSLEAFGSPSKPFSSVTILCRSVKRTVSGSVLGCVSESWMPISSASSHPNVGGMYCSLWIMGRAWPFSVLCFLRVILIPLGNFYNDIFCAVGNALAAQARFWSDAGGFVELIEFGIGGFVAGFETLVNDYVAGGAGANAAAGMVEAHVIALGDVENTAGNAVV